jgi:hypothetical protein
LEGRLIANPRLLAIKKTWHCYLTNHGNHDGGAKPSIMGI